MKVCRYCGKKLIRKIWFGKRKYTENIRRFTERHFCGTDCWAKQLSIDGKGENNYFYGKHLPAWNKGIYLKEWKTKDTRGYVRVFYRDENNKRYFRYEHRIVFEREMNIKLKKRDIIHHINKNTSDNHIENLLLCTPHNHGSFHCRKKS